jgi:hypothetical protein
MGSQRKVLRKKIKCNVGKISEGSQRRLTNTFKQTHGFLRVGGNASVDPPSKYKASKNCEFVVPLLRTPPKKAKVEKISCLRYLLECNVCLIDCTLIHKNPSF